MVVGVGVLTAALGLVLLAPAAGASEPGAAYVTDGTVEFVDGDGTQTDTGASAAVVGPVTDLEGDGSFEVPTVNGSGYVRIVHADGTTETLVAGDAATTSIAVADASGDGAVEILYQNTSDGSTVYSVDQLGNTRKLADVETSGVVGHGDFVDDDGDDETVFLGSSGRIKYTDDGKLGSTDQKVPTSSGVGVGPLADFDLDGTPRVAFVDGSNNLALVNHTGHKETLDENYQQASKAPVGASDLETGKNREVIHVQTDGDLSTMTTDGTASSVTDDTGVPITADTGVGAAGRLSSARSPPVIEIVKPTEQTYLSDSVPLNVTANEPVADWNYSVNGGSNVSFEPNTTLDRPSGRYEVTVYATDEDGNEANRTRTFTVGEPTSMLVFVDNETGNLSYVTPSGSVVRTPVTGGDEIKATGPAFHYDGDDQLEIPYVKPDGEDDPALYLYHLGDGSKTCLDTDVMSDVDRSKIALADWDDDRRFDVVYPGTNGDLMRVDADEEPTAIVTSETSEDGTDPKPWGIFGSVDIGYNENGEDTADREIVWLDSSTGVKAVSQSDPTNIREVDFDTTPGTSDNVGVGEPLPLTEDGPKYFPIVDGSEHPGLLNASDKTGVTLNGSSSNDDKATKSPTGLGDMTGDGRKELVFANTEGVLKYTTTNLEAAPDNPVSTLVVNDKPVTVSRHHGVLSTHFPQRVYGFDPASPSDTTPPADNGDGGPEITNYDVSADGNEITVSFDSDENLAEATVEITGAETATLDREEFSGDRFSGFSATYDAGTDGRYTVELTEARDSSYNDGVGRESFRQSVTVDAEDDATATPTSTATDDPATPAATPTATDDPATPAATATPERRTPTPTPTPSPTRTAEPNGTEAGAPPDDASGAVTTYVGGGYSWWWILLLFVGMVFLAGAEMHLVDQQE